MVTVLFADLVDSTGLARRLDPERAREVLGRFYDATSEELYALRGQPEKFIGDAVMAVFGLPQTHEDDAVRAVRAGLAIRGRLRRLSQELGLDRPLEVHVGVESGEAATGMGPSSQLLITGPVVNAAARLQAAAAPGEVLVGELARALTETSVSFAEARTVPAKGFDTELTAFPVQGLTTRSARRTIPFVGRADELALLRQSFARRTGHGHADALHRRRRARHRQVPAARRVRRRRGPGGPHARGPELVRSATRPRSRRSPRWCATRPASTTAIRRRRRVAG